jgi:hypothetical protein
VDSELDYRSPYDIAAYNNSTDPNEDIYGDQLWGEKNVGETWWDLTNAIYIDYEQDSLIYRQGNWGKLYPAASIDVYEWTKSTIPPEEYSETISLSASGIYVDGIELTGEPYETYDEYGNPQFYWVEETQFNFKSGKYETYYYFWVKNKTTVPNNKRLYSVSQLAGIIRNPSDYGINWVAAISEDTIIVNNLNTCVPCNGAVLKLILERYDTELHSEYQLLAEGSPYTKIPEWLHIGLRDALSGRDNLSIEKFYTDWRLRDYYYPGDVVKFNGEFWITYQRHRAYTTTYLMSAEGDFILDEDDQYIILNLNGSGNSPLDAGSLWTKITDYEIIKDFKDYPIDEFGYAWDTYAWDRRPWDWMAPDSIYDFDGLIRIDAGLIVPDYRLHPFMQYGIEISPRQSMLMNRPESRKTATNKLNRIFNEINLVDIRPEALDILNSVIDINGIEYNLNQFFVMSDWGQPGLTHRTKTNYIVDTVDDISKLNTAIIGETVKVRKSNDVDGVNRRSIFVLTQDGWQKIFKEKATVYFCDNIWDSEKYEYGWDTGKYDDVNYDLDYPRFFKQLLNIIRTNILTNELEVMYNDFWFTMLKYMFSEQEHVDWALKSSYLRVELEDELSTNRKLFKKFPYTDLMEYLNSNKPYRAKVRRIDDKRTYNETHKLSASDNAVFEVFFYSNPALMPLADEENNCLTTEASNVMTVETLEGPIEVIENKAIVFVNSQNQSIIPITPDDDYRFTLASDILSTDTMVELSGDIECFAGSDPGVIWIGGERIEYGYIAGNTVYDLTRGTSGTVALEHKTGDIAFLQSTGEFPVTEFENLFLSEV